MNVRRLVSLTALISFLFLSTTGLMLFLAPQGRVAYWAGWSLLGLSKEQYGDLHTSFMVLFLIVAVWHIVLNWRAITKYLKGRTRRLRIFTPEFSVALLLSVTVLLGTLGRTPPFRNLLELGDSFDTFWEHREGEPPWGHAEANPLERFVRGLVDWERTENQRMIRLDLDTVLAVLEEEGITVSSPKRKVLDIAGDNDITPKDLMAIVLTAAEPATPGKHLAIKSPGTESEVPALLTD